MPDTAVRVRYYGPAARAGMIAQMLRTEGVEVTYTPPVEPRDLQSVADGVVVYFIANYTDTVVRAAVVKVKQRIRERFGRDADLEVEGGEDSP